MKYVVSLFLVLESLLSHAQFEIVGNEFKGDKLKEIEKKSVRIVYLVSSDREIDSNYLHGIEIAAFSVQEFYKKELLGLTFTLNKPIVEILKSDKKASYFYSSPSDDNPENWGYFNAFNEVSRLLGAKFNDENFIWVIYSDGPGDKGRGGSGVCVMPEDDLLGLAGKHPTQPDTNRWIGGLAHELGHALGLSHPENLEEHSKAIMWTGIYGYYPTESYFTDYDKISLICSSFINLDKRIIIKYPEGYFGGIDEINTTWTEYRSNGSNNYFKIIELKNDHVILKSEDRNLLIKLPLEKGLSYTSSDNGKNWQKWWVIP